MPHGSRRPLTASRASLEILDSDTAPHLWAEAQDCLGRALKALSERTGDTAMEGGGTGVFRAS